MLQRCSINIFELDAIPTDIVAITSNLVQVLAVVTDEPCQAARGARYRIYKQSVWIHWSTAWKYIIDWAIRRKCLTAAEVNDGRWIGDERSENSLVQFRKIVVVEGDRAVAEIT